MDGVAAMSRFRLVWKCAGRGRLRQAEPRCGRGCRDEPVLAGVGMRRPGAVAAGGAVLRTELPCGYGWRSRAADGVAVWLWLAEPRCGREELRQGKANRLRDCGAVRQPVDVPGHFKDYLDYFIYRTIIKFGRPR